MDKLHKNNRQVSGSRSKSKKSKPNDASIDLKPHKTSQALYSNQHTSKVKTDNSLNKSKGSKKCTKYAKKPKILKTGKNDIDESKDISRSVSAERKHSLVKMNRTEANFQNEDIQKRIRALKRTLDKIEKPSSASSHRIYAFYRQIQDSVETVSQPLYSLLSFLHDLYLTPISQILDMIAPYEHLLQRKEQLSREVEQQVKYNQEIYGQLTQEQIHIIKLKETIQQQRQAIEEKKKEQQQRFQHERTNSFKKFNQLVVNDHQKDFYDNQLNSNGNENVAKKNWEDGIFRNEGLKNMKKQKEKSVYEGIAEKQKLKECAFGDKEKLKDSQHEKQVPQQIRSNLTFKQHLRQKQAERDYPDPFHQKQGKEPKQTIISLKSGGLKLNLGAMSKNEAVGFHDQFYSKIDQFSQSWRNQALRQKRF